MKALLLTLLMISTAHAVPVLNRNLAAEGTLITIWPDHADPDHFYFAPNFMKIATDRHNKVKFHFTEYTTGNCSAFGRRLGTCQNRALLTSLLMAGYEDKQLKEAQEGIKKLRPNARFSAIPYLASKVEFDETLKRFVDEHSCSPLAGQAADEVPCSITFNSRGVKKLKPFLNDGKIIAFHFIYKISGLVEGRSSEFVEQQLDYGLTVNLGGEMLVNHPEL